MNLELKHVQHYPIGEENGLKFLTSKHQIKYGERHIMSMNGMSIDTDGKLNIEFLYKNDLMFSNSMNKVFPIYHPLSDLTKEIEHNGEKFVPARWYYDGIPETRNTPMSLEYLKCGKDIQTKPYWWVQKLFEWHFNVFDLPEELWIDINTLQS